MRNFSRYQMRIARAIRAFTPRRFASAAATSTSILKEQAATLFSQGVTKFEQDDIQEAKELFEQALAADPGCENVNFNLGNCSYALKDPEGALEYWQRSAEQRPRADAHLNMANVYALVEKQLSKALPHYKKAVELEPNDGEIRFNYGVVLEAAARFPEAIEEYQSAKKLGINTDKNLRNVLAKYAGQQADAEPVDATKAKQ